MKFISVSILLICLLAATFSQTLICMAFEINQNYIARYLCVNRNNPHSSCNGHCYLSKQLAAHEKSPGTTNTIKEKTDVLLYLNVSVNNTENIVSSVNKKQHSQYSFCLQQVCSEFFHPPATA